MTVFIIILAVCALAIAVGVIWQKKDEWAITPLIIYPTAGLVMFLAGLVLGANLVNAPRKIDMFRQQKEYIEQYQPTTDYDMVAILQTKLEFNAWLYRAQYTKEHLPALSFYGDEIMELEPIE